MAVTLRWCLCWGLLGLLAGTGLAGAEPAPELGVDALLERLRAAPAGEAARVLGETWNLAPAQVEAVLALPLSALAGFDDAGLRRLLAAAGADEQRLVDLARKRLTAGEGMVLPVAGDRADAGSLTGGVGFELDRISLTGEAMDFTLAPIAGGRSLLETVDLRGDGDGGRVVVDTRESLFPSLAFRGLLRPGRLRLERRAPDSDAPATVVYHLVLEDLGAFDGLMRNAEGQWIPTAGEADRLELEVVADLVAGRLADPRLQRMVLVAEEGGRAQLRQDEPRQEVEIRSSRITLEFAPEGGLVRARGARDSEVVGRPHGARSQGPAGLRPEAGE